MIEIKKKKKKKKKDGLCNCGYSCSSIKLRQKFN